MSNAPATPQGPPPLADAGTRVQSFARGGELGTVAQVLREQREEILRRWLSAAGLQPFHRGQPERVVADHIPDLFDALVALLERSASRDVDAVAPLEDPAVLEAAEAHARQRVLQGIRPTDVVVEFRLLRQEIGRALRRALEAGMATGAAGGVALQAAAPTATPGDVLAAELLVHDALDGAIGLALESLTAYVDSAVRELREHIAEQQRVGQEQARLLDLAHDAILVRAFGNGKIEFWSRGAEALYGWRQDEVLGRHKTEVLQPQLPRPLAELEVELERTGEWSGELTHTCREGRRVVVASRWALRRDDAGRPLSVLEINRDVTDQRRAEDELRALATSLEERVAERTAALELARRRAAFLAEAGSVLASALDYEATLANVARLAVPAIADWCAVDMVGEDRRIRRLAVAHVDPAKVELAHELQRRYPPDPDASTGVAHVIHSGEAELVPEIPDAVLVRAARSEEDLALFRSLGLRSYMTVPLGVRGATLGAITFVAAETERQFGQDDLALAQDLARRAAQAVENARLYQQTQEAGARSRRLQLATAALAEASTPDAVAAAVLDQGLGALGARAGIVALLRGTVGDKAAVLEMLRSANVAAETVEQWRQMPLGASVPLAEAVRNCEPVWLETPDELRQRYPVLATESDALQRGNAWCAIPLVQEGRVLGALGLTFAEARRFGPEDRSFIETLAGVCAQALARALLFQEAEQSRATAEAAVRLRDQVLAAVAHDLRTPLTAISGQAQMVTRRARQAADIPDAARLATSGERILEAARRMGRWIDQLSDLARTQIGQALPLNRQPTNLVALSEQLAAEHQRNSEAHRVVVRAAVPTLTGNWDPARLERLLDNLLGNAIKYSPQGGTVTVEVSAEQQDGHEWAVLRMRDQGLGIPAADLPHVFEPFRRAGNVGKAIAGTGVGLASARMIVEAHGGTIAVESVEAGADGTGGGSTFTVRLPLAAPMAPEQ